MRRRSQLLISDEVQHSLLLRVTIHWVLFLLANFMALAIWIYWIEMPTASSAERQSELLRVCIPLLACSLIVVPVFLYDVAKLSNQFAGPIRRIRMSLSAYLNNGQVEPISLRQDDFWQSLASDINKVVCNQAGPAAVAGKKETLTNNYPES